MFLLLFSCINTKRKVRVLKTLIENLISKLFHFYYMYIHVLGSFLIGIGPKITQHYIGQFHSLRLDQDPVIIILKPSLDFISISHFLYTGNFLGLAPAPADSSAHARSPE